MKPRVLLADDHALLLDAFARLLAGTCEIVGTAANGSEAVASVRALAPDIVVLDISMPGLNGLEAGRQIKTESPDTKLVYVTMNEDADMAAEAFRAGASAYLLKRSAASELLRAIHEAMNGHSYVTPLVTDALVGALRSTGPQKAIDLTPRQRDVLRLIGRGHSMKEAAAELKVTPRTVAFHKYRMMAQLNITTTAQLIQYAVKHAIV
jgi:DNA-binding NarL/FixJ family response regulator